jgi:surface antigen
MTRGYRAIHLSCARAFFIASLTAVSLAIAAPAMADVAVGSQESTVGIFDDSDTTPNIVSSVANTVTQALNPASQDDADEAPKTETAFHHFYCVEYARLRSGLEIFGDAKTWWARAKNLYDEITTPAADAVMVFSTSSRIRKGHVAVVTKVISPREIRVDQANWQNHGEIDKNTPVLDVSRANDWSEVRVWDTRSGQYGGHVYRISGFITRPVTISSAD